MSQSGECNGDAATVALNVDEAVRQRYSAASRAAEPSLCTPVDYDDRLLTVLPQEIIERDYGCGDPSRYVRPGEWVLDLGSGGGKICYIISQLVGKEGRVIGVDVNDDMLDLARRYRQEIGQRLGYDNVQFFKGHIQDLALDLEKFERYLQSHPVKTASDWLLAQEHADQLRASQPMIAAESVDVVVSNCVLNLVKQEDRPRLFREIYRVLRRGGRAVISDIVCDEPVPARLQNDPSLWSGCISGAFVEAEFFRAFEEAGFYGMRYLVYEKEAWGTVEGIEFRSVTIEAFKGKEGPCMDHRQAVVYQGPWKAVMDDDGHTLRRGERMAVCEKTFEIYNRQPYAQDILPVQPHHPVDPKSALPFNCRNGAVREPRETKGNEFQLTQLPEEGCCGPGTSC